jgi:glutathione S-transferase
MGLEYELEKLPFPPRFFKKEFLGENVLGTVPFFKDNEVSMTESTGICQYLVDRYQKHEFSIAIDHPEYGDYLNWLHHSDATLTFPQTIFLRYSVLEPEERRQPQVAEDYRKWFLARLRRLEAHIMDKNFLCGNRFTIADIAIGYALFLGKLQGFSGDYPPQINRYLNALVQRPAFIRAMSRTSDDPSNFKLN